MQNIQLNGYNLLKEHWKGVSRLRIEQLRYIADIAETGSLTATAQRQFVSQQAISKTIKQLEKELDAEILIRTRSGVAFTEIGKELVGFAQKVLEEETNFYNHVSQIKHATKKKAHNDLYIASTSSIANLLLPVLVANPKIQENNVTIHIDNNTTYEEVVERVSNKTSDFGLITINEFELSHLMKDYQKDLEATVIMKDKIIALMDKRFYTGNSSQLTDEELNISKVRTLYNIHPIGIYQQPVIEHNIICSGDADFHRNMMEKAGAVTFMSVISYQMHFNNKRYIPLSVPDEAKEQSLVHVAIHRKSAGKQMDNLLNLLRRELVYEGVKAK